MKVKGGPLQGVSIVVSTKRPQFFRNILNNFNRQRYNKKELVIVLHSDRVNLERYRKIASPYKNVSVYQMAEKHRLGRCLNYGIGKTKYPLIAKFDDDDYYSPYYLSEQCKMLSRTGTHVIGKRAYFVYLEASKKLIIRFPKQGNRFGKYVTGGTILFRRSIKVRFTPSASLGEDIDFLYKCRLRGYKIYASSPYNYVYLRRKNRLSHSWKTTDRFLMKGSKLVGRMNGYRGIATRKT